MSEPTPEELARLFHETYERLAPSFGYETRKESAKPWESVPVQNKLLMTAVCDEIVNGPIRAARLAGWEECREACLKRIDGSSYGHGSTAKNMERKLRDAIAALTPPAKEGT